MDRCQRRAPSLLSDALPVMLRQGNSRGARELVNTADRLATSSLSNAPAPEIELRARLIDVLVFGFNDFEASLEQAELMSDLSSRVSDDQLKSPRERVRIRVVAARLWAANGQRPAVEKAMRELDGLYEEFMGRTPPDKFPAAICLAVQGSWFKTFQMPELAEERLAAACELLPEDLKELNDSNYRISADYVAVLADVGKLSLAEKVARENLKLPPDANQDTRAAHLNLVQALGDTLCRQDRFEEALRMLEEQRRVLADCGGSEADLQRVDARKAELVKLRYFAGMTCEEAAEVLGIAVPTAK